jgi:pimeloyl-ACP methyl ester carboxylesterase
MNKTLGLAAAAALAAAGLAACGGGDDGAPPAPAQLTAASAAALNGSCADVAGRIAYPDTAITAVNSVAAGTVGGLPAPAHCQVTGKMFQRTSSVDSKTYAIGFELRLPLNWNGRFFYQANGGTDGSVLAATGPVGGGGPSNDALNMGFAVISSDAGHDSSQNPSFGVDPQARLDYGYQAAAKLTPMAKALIQSAYGKGPDRSYFGGCSNGGRHTMVAASRMPDQYDGYLVGDPGFRLPLAATANIAGYQKYNTVARTPGTPSTGFTAGERALVSNAVLAKCDALDGVTDGLVQDTQACQARFDLARDVPTCSGAPDDTCLTTAQKSVISGLFAGVTTSTGAKIYASWPYDNGLQTGGWSFWKFTVPPLLDSGAVGIIFQVPPEDPATFNGANFALTGNVDTMLAKVNATNATYTESAMSFMTPPNASDMSRVRNRGAKMVVYHGTADPIFSSEDTKNWYTSLSNAASFARYYQVPGMNHCSGGPATDQFDMLTPLVNWVEYGVAPESVTATARGPGNAVAVNGDVPGTWAANRTRPLCPFPKVARYKGFGNAESADSFVCQ